MTIDRILAEVLVYSEISQNGLGELNKLALSEYDLPLTEILTPKFAVADVVDTENEVQQLRRLARLTGIALKSPFSKCSRIVGHSATGPQPEDS